jgi:spermidine/putrescine transport system permease protein
MKKSFFSPNTSFFWGIIALVWQVVFFYIPLSFLVATSFIKYTPSLNSSHFTFFHYFSLFQPIYAQIFLRSFGLALSTVIITLMIAYPVAYYLAVKVQRWRELGLALLILPFWTNFLLLVYAWYFLLENDGLINDLLLRIGLISEPLHMMNTTFAVHIGMVYCYLPFMLLPLYSSLEKLDLRLLEASADLGATYWQTLWNVIFPLTWPGIRIGATLVFVPAFGEFVVPALLGGDKNMYVGSVITHYFLTIRDVSLGSAFTCLSIVVLFLILLLFIGLGTLFVRKREGGDV